MTTKNEALKMAIETLEAFEITGYCDETIQACKEALEQPMINGLTESETNQTMSVKGLSEQPAQKPVYIVKQNGNCTMQLKSKDWVGLSDDEILELKIKHVDYELFDEGEYGTECNVYVDDFYHAIEAKLKEKNL